jgi:hypothetical protein
VAIDAQSFERAGALTDACAPWDVQACLTASMGWQMLSDSLVTKPGWREAPDPCWCYGPPEASKLRVIVEPDGSYVVHDAVANDRHNFSTLGELLSWLDEREAELTGS